MVALLLAIILTGVITPVNAETETESLWIIEEEDSATDDVEAVYDPMSTSPDYPITPEGTPINSDPNLGKFAVPANLSSNLRDAFLQIVYSQIEKPGVSVQSHIDSHTANQANPYSYPKGGHAYWGYMAKYPAGWFDNNTDGFSGPHGYGGTTFASRGNPWSKYHSEIAPSSSGGTGPWCASFISWCAKYAGVPNSIIPKTTAVDGFIIPGRNLYTRTQCQQLRNLKPGDIAIYKKGSAYLDNPSTAAEGPLGTSPSHVGVIISALDSNNQFWMIDGNWGGGVCLRKESLANISGIYSPPWPVTSKPSKPTISQTNSNGMYDIGAAITFNYSATGSTDYGLGLYKWNGTQYARWNPITNQYDNSSVISRGTATSYSYTPSIAGSYAIYVTASNSAGYTNSDWIYFTAKNPLTTYGWLSETPMGNSPATYLQNASYFFNYRIYDSVTEKNIDVDYNLSYSAKVTVTRPDGSTIATYTFTNDNNSISFICDVTGQYKAALLVSGQMSSSGTRNFTVTASTSAPIITLLLDTATDVQINGGARREMRFTAPMAGTYRFESSDRGPVDPKAYVAATGDAYYSDDDSEIDSFNYMFEQNLTAGQTFIYYSGVYGDVSENWTYKVTVSRSAVPITLLLDTLINVQVTEGARRELRFTAPTAGTYRFESMNRGELDPRAYISAYGDDSWGDDGGISGLDYIFTQNLAAGQTFIYYSGLFGESIESGSYDVIVSKVAAPITLLLDTLVNVPITGGIRRELHFTAPFDGTYQFGSMNRGELDPTAYISVYGDDSWGDDGGMIALDYTFTQFLATGETFVYYSGLYGESTESGSYDVLVSRIVEPITLLLGTAVTVQITNGMRRELHFTTLSGGIYQFETTNCGELDPVAYLSAYGDALWGDDGGMAPRDYVFTRRLAAGETFIYYSGLYGESSESGSYDVLVSRISDPITLWLDTDTSVQITNGMRRVLCFTAPTDGIYQFASTDRGILDPTAYVSAYNNDCWSDDGGQPDTLNYLFAVSLAANETFIFYSGVWGDSSAENNTGTYKVSVYRISNFFSQMPGDADCDTEVTAADAALVLRYLAGLSTITEQGMINADVDGGGISASDAAIILRYLAGLASFWE